MRQTTGKQNVRKLLEAGYRANAENELAIAAEWFPLEEEAWRIVDAMSNQPQLLHVIDLTATVSAPIEVSPSRRLIPITGGEVLGPKVKGKILDGGTDYQFIRPDGVAKLQARYVIQTNSGDLVYVENNAVRTAHTRRWGA